MSFQGTCLEMMGVRYYLYVTTLGWTGLWFFYAFLHPPKVWRVNKASTEQAQIYIHVIKTSGSQMELLLLQQGDGQFWIQHGDFSLEPPRGSRGHFEAVLEALLVTGSNPARPPSNLHSASEKLSSNPTSFQAHLHLSFCSPSTGASSVNDCCIGNWKCCFFITRFDYQAIPDLNSF